MAQTSAPHQRATPAARQDDGAETVGEAQQDDNGQSAARTTDVRPNPLCGRLGRMAALQYRNGTLDPELQLLMSAHPDDDLRRAGDLPEALASQTGLVQQVEAPSRSFAAQRVTAQTRLSALQAEQRRLAAAKEQIQRKLAAARQLQDNLDVALRDVMGPLSRAPDPPERA